MQYSHAVINLLMIMNSWPAHDIPYPGSYDKLNVLCMTMRTMPVLYVIGFMQVQQSAMLHVLGVHLITCFLFGQCYYYHIAYKFNMTLYVMHA